MRSLLLVLALVCGIQATVVPRTMEDLDLQKVRGRPGWVVSCRVAREGSPPQALGHEQKP
ncbi:hypothetical protein VULLAG_LOCUS932 [Vulpes lagopus]